ncbi:MAG: NAD(P)-dependent oxidoreductase, partial [Anaerolineales bacterium]
LEVGHQVSALVRDPNRLSEATKRADMIVGDVLNPQQVAATISGTDAVVVSLGSRSNSPENTVSQGTKNIITCMQQTGVKRLVVVTSLGVGDSKDQVPMAFKLVMKTVMRKIMADKELQEQYVQESGLDWVIVRPGGLSDDPASGAYLFGTDPSVMAGRVSRADVAAFVLQNLSDDQFLGQAVAIT